MRTTKGEATMRGWLMKASLERSMTKGAKPPGRRRKMTNMARELPDHIRIDDHHNSQFCAVGSAADQHNSIPGGGCSAKGQQRPSRSAAGRCADGLCALDPIPSAQSGQSTFVESRPVCAVGWPRLDVALQFAPPHWLRLAAGANQTI